jgi:heat shock transcription factor, other eukaryote
MGSYGGFDPQVSNDQFLQFGYQPPLESSQVSYNDSSIPQPTDHRTDAGGGSNQLARRPANQVVSRDGGCGDSNDVHWTEQGNGQRLDGARDDDIDDLKQRAQVAKREAQSKRKQIPPFIQKLAR